MGLMLGIDCSMRWTSLGLALDEEVLAEVNIDLGRRQAEKLPELVSELLSQRGCTLGDLAHIAVTVGPGYYTGIRVGLAYACALAEGLSLPVIPIPTLYPFIRDLQSLPYTLVPVLRARRSSFYAGFYRANEREQRFALDAAHYEEGVLHSLLKREPDVLLVGRDAQKLSTGGLYPILDRMASSGASVALAGVELKYAAVSSHLVTGTYLREPDFG